MTTSYTVKLKQFEGPFDLLLFFIERDELDIYDIPIATITDEYLKYIQDLESLNINVASEFILVAATLMRIKAKLLLPRKEVDEQGQEIDPREELVRRLIEYKKYKSVLSTLRLMESERTQKQPRGNLNTELYGLAEKALVDVELESVTLFKIMKAFDRVMNRFNTNGPKQVHQILQYPYTVKDEQERIISMLSLDRDTAFDSVFVFCQDRIHAIVAFLAILELLNTQQIHIIQGEGVNNFWLQPLSQAVAIV